jgi:hypothetical protein
MVSNTTDLAIRGIGYHPWDFSLILAGRGLPWTACRAPWRSLWCMVPDLSSVVPRSGTKEEGLLFMGDGDGHLLAHKFLCPFSYNVT